MTSRNLLGLALVFVLALVPRLVAVEQYQSAHPQAEHLAIDEESYDLWARELAAGDWLGHEVFFQEPLYPYALGALYAVLGPERHTARIVQALLGALCCVLMVLVARRVFGARAGWIAGGALALYGPAIWMSCLLLKPNLFLPVLLALLLAVPQCEGRARRWVLVGVLAGLGALLRGNVLVLLPAIVAWPLVRAVFRGTRDSTGRLRAIRLAAAVAAGVLLVLLPVALRNQAVGGVFALTTSGAGTNLYGGNNALNPRGVATEFPWVRGIPRYEADDWRREAERRTQRELDPGEVSAFWSSEVLRSVRTDPLLHTRILGSKLRVTLGAYEVPDNHLFAWDKRYVPILRLPWPSFGVWGILGLAGMLCFLVSRGPSRDRKSVELLVVFALYLATIVLTVTSSRIRLALVPLLLPFAAAYLVRLPAVLRDKRTALVPFFALLVAALLVHVPVFDARERHGDFADRDHNHAVQLLEQGRTTEAGELARKLADDWPTSARIQVLLADIEWREGWALSADPATRDAGRRAVQRALERLRGVIERPGIAPKEVSRARRLAGWIQLALGNAEGAERHFRAARVFAVDDGALLLGHSQALVALVEAGREDFAPEARELLNELARLPGHAEVVRDLRARLE